MDGLLGEGKRAGGSGGQYLPAGFSPAVPVPGEPSRWVTVGSLGQPRALIPCWVRTDVTRPRLSPAGRAAGQEQQGARLGTGVPMA